MQRRAVIHKLNDYSYCIDDAGDSCCYVVCGKEKAAVIDTVNGMEDLKKIVREITDLPLVVINTHGHCDHVYGNTFFEEAYIHPDDMALHDAHFAMKQHMALEKALEQGRTEEEFRRYVAAKPCPLKPVTEGEIVNLGGVDLEVIRIKGHTQGSIGLLDRASGNFFTGDAINKGQHWMQLDESSSMREYEKSLEALAAFRGDIKELHGGHSVPAIEPGYIDVMRDGVKELIETKGEGDGTVKWFGGVARCHVLCDGNTILYTDAKL